ncbi:exodeoxyribonuclease III [Rhodovibrionaceae bacterium A322]
MVKLATWNINSVKARLPIFLNWLETFSPDVLMLQELKGVTENFPKAEVEALGYHAAVVGQKAYNGVALLSKAPLENVIERLPGDETDEEARYVEATTFGLRVASLYLPNGNPVDSLKYPYKLSWMERLRVQAEKALQREEPMIFAGDYNIIPENRDCYDPKAWADDALFRLESRQAFRRILNLGYVDAFRALNQEDGAYTFWDYQRGAWQKDLGIRIDHHLLSAQAADRLVAVGIDKDPREPSKDKEAPKPSDHTPMWIELSD